MRESKAGRTDTLVLAGLVCELAKGALDLDGLAHLQLVQRGADEVLGMRGAHSMAARVCLHMAERCYAPKETQVGQMQSPGRMYKLKRRAISNYGPSCLHHQVRTLSELPLGGGHGSKVLPSPGVQPLQGFQWTLG